MSESHHKVSIQTYWQIQLDSFGRYIRRWTGDTHRDTDLTYWRINRKKQNIHLGLMPTADDPRFVCVGSSNGNRFT